MKAIIFDFDGVIIDSMGIKSDAFASVYAKYGKEIVDKVVAHHLKNGGMSRYKKFKYYHQTFLNQTITDEEIKQLDAQFSAYVMSKIDKVPFVKGVIEFLEANKSFYKYYISSGTPEYELKKVVDLLKIAHYFDGIYGSPDDKIQHITAILKQTKLHPKMVLFIGDGMFDKIAAEKTYVNFLARISSQDSLLKNERFKINDFTEADSVIAMIDAANSIV